jgi:DNA-binding response OmpR family regulator
MLTCLTGTLTRLNGIASGADDYLVKPLRTPSLVERIRWAIRHRLKLLSHQD